MAGTWVKCGKCHKVRTNHKTKSCKKCRNTTALIPVSKVDHPAHYGGQDNPYEAIKVIEAWGLGFNLGNCAKYICRAGKKGEALIDLQKALWYLNREVNNLGKGTNDDCNQGQGKGQDQNERQSQTKGQESPHEAKEQIR